MTTTDHNHETANFNPDFHIVIVGAGLVGLELAILLRKAGYRVTVLARDAELRSVKPLPLPSFDPSKLPYSENNADTVKSTRSVQAFSCPPIHAECWPRLAF